MLLGQFSPGPDFLLILKNALNHGRKAAFFSAAGISLGLIIHTTLAIAGLGAKDVMGYCVMALIGSGVIICAGFLLF